ncbi:MAG TPA: class I SAM-dependent methyltransferase [Mesorhizobium sp.]|jgi:predicted TPR repeat methyltransferase|nr:class I SAM-dependent methyltransferase [Mesorhizobium sp.]
MSHEGEDRALDLVYAARTPEGLASAYQAWSPTYDHETISLGYCLPFVIGGWIARYVPKGTGPILDVGCGTGLAAPWLQALGYPEIHGMDFSPAMLNLAEARGAYARLTRATLGEPLPWADHTFAAAFATGVFTEGHAPAESLDEIARIVHPGGHVVLTVRDSVLVKGGFGQVFERLQRERRWEPVEQSPSFRSFAISEPEVLVRTFVFSMCQGPPDGNSGRSAPQPWSHR